MYGGEYICTASRTATFNFAHTIFTILMLVIAFAGSQLVLFNGTSRKRKLVAKAIGTGLNLALDERVCSLQSMNVTLRISCRYPYEVW